MLELFWKYHFIVMELTGICLFLTLIFRKSKLIRTDWNKVAAFVGFMVLAQYIRMGLMDNQYFEIEPDHPGVSFNTMIWVFWEDAFFAMPIYFFKDYLKSHKYVWVTVAVLLSLWFGSLHVYQGYFAAAVISVYPFFLSYKFGAKHGFGTVMACHIIYDITTHLGYKIMCLIKLMPV